MVHNSNILIFQRLLSGGRCLTQWPDKILKFAFVQVGRIIEHICIFELGSGIDTVTSDVRLAWEKGRVGRDKGERR